MRSDLLRLVDLFLADAAKPLIVLVGPTASGKTALSLELARHVGGEIINADSRQLYAHLDIGTAKISPKDMQGIPHHLLSVKDPKEEVTVGRYQEEARKVIDDILARGKVPLLAGGSMLYVASITDGLTLAPRADPVLRRRLEDAYDRDGGTTLYKRLQAVDAEAASSIHLRNKPYVIRALEIYETLRQPKSVVVRRGEGVIPSPSASLGTGSDEGCTHGVSGFVSAQPDTFEQKSCSYDTLLLGAKRLKSDLEERIRERVEEMFVQGWIEEVRDLLARGYGPSDPGMKSTGYREIIAYLQELEAAGSDADLEAMQEALKKKIATKTRQYAKRQLTWWRNDPRIVWVHLDTDAW